ncbi:MAG: hypothetical protein WC356_07705 [Candidatus Micrarchaeia archaeon]|jgi:hypothetical protein
MIQKTKSKMRLITNISPFFRGSNIEMKIKETKVAFDLLEKVLQEKTRNRIPIEILKEYLIPNLINYVYGITQNEEKIHYNELMILFSILNKTQIPSNLEIPSESFLINLTDLSKCENFVKNSSKIIEEMHQAISAGVYNRVIVDILKEKFVIKEIVSPLIDNNIKSSPIDEIPLDTNGITLTKFTNPLNEDDNSLNEDDNSLINFSSSLDNSNAQLPKYTHDLTSDTGFLTTSDFLKLDIRSENTKFFGTKEYNLKLKNILTRFKYIYSRFVLTNKIDKTIFKKVFCEGQVTGLKNMLISYEEYDCLFKLSFEIINAVPNDIGFLFNENGDKDSTLALMRRILDTIMKMENKGLEIFG